MKTVIKLNGETVISETKLASGKTVGLKSPKSVTWAVCENGAIIFDNNLVTGEMMPSIWPSKKVARRVAGI